MREYNRASSPEHKKTAESGTTQGRCRHQCNRRIAPRPVRRPPDQSPNMRCASAKVSRLQPRPILTGSTGRARNMIGLVMPGRSECACRETAFAASRPAKSFGVGDRHLAFDHLLATVVAILRDMVTQVHFARSRIGRKLLGGEGIVRAAHAAAGRGFTTFGDCHDNSPGESRLASKRT